MDGLIGNLTAKKKKI